MPKKKILLTVGIRPDGNKIAPLYNKFKSYSDIFDTVLVNTGQHEVILTEMLNIFDVKEDYNLKTMKQGQNLFQITASMLESLGQVLEKEKPDFVFAPNDGTTTFVTALAAYYLKIPIGHVEAGLRTYDLYNPFPEEGNRKMTSALTNFHFAPTPRAKENLIFEGVSEESIFVSGNTVIDALYYVTNKHKNYVFEENAINNIDFTKKKVILLTTHRRENWGEPMKRALLTIKQLVKTYQDIEVIFPVHPNPIVRDLAKDLLSDLPKVHLIEPLSYVPMVMLMSKCYLVISDSGGIQEEAPTFGKPTLVMRKTTERPEGVEAGVAKLVDTDSDLIFNEVSKLITDEAAYATMSRKNNPYGDGHACERIVWKTANLLGYPNEFRP